MSEEAAATRGQSAVSHLGTVRRDRVVLTRSIGSGAALRGGSDFPVTAGAIAAPHDEQNRTPSRCSAPQFLQNGTPRCSPPPKRSAQMLVESARRDCLGGALSRPVRSMVGQPSGYKLVSASGPRLLLTSLA